MSKNILWLIGGYLCIVLGIIGFIMPIMPAAPFILLAAYCFFRGSKKAFIRLYYFPFLGRYVRQYYEGKGIPRLFKNIAIIITWFCTTFTTIIIAYTTWQYLLTISFAMLSTAYIVWLPTLPPRKKEDVILVDGKLPPDIVMANEASPQNATAKAAAPKTPKHYRPIPQASINKNIPRKAPVIKNPLPQIRAGEQLISGSADNPLIESANRDQPEIF